MAYTLPTPTDFKNYFTRDFPYGSDPSTVMDADIQKAIDEANFNVNQGLFSSQAQFTIGYLYLTAHYLVMDLRASSQGIQGNYSWLQNAKSVGNVSESFSIPPRILDNPEFAIFSKTFYGAKYLSLVLPLLVGQMFTTYNRPHP